MDNCMEEECMVVRSEGRYKFYILGAFLLLLGLGAAAVIIQRQISILVVFILPFLLLFQYWIVTGKTIEMDKDGCTITFLFYKKRYLWNEIRFRKYEDAEDFRWYRTAFVKSVIFSPKKIYKPVWMDITLYCILLHPLSVFYVYFKPKQLISEEFLIYCVEEEAFRQHLTEWGVELLEEGR